MPLSAFIWVPFFSVQTMYSQLFSFVLAAWLDDDDAAAAYRVLALYLSLGGMLIILLEISTPQFILEYDTRPNRLYVDYLKHPKEVFGMLWKGYKGIVLGGSLL